MLHSYYRVPLDWLFLESLLFYGCRTLVLFETLMSVTRAVGGARVYMS
jgi:hypothetical protein